MGFLTASLVFLLGTAESASISRRSINPDDYINVFMGADDGGHVFPGPSYPFGMVKMGVDVTGGKDDPYAGYLSSGQIYGVSMMHESGTGGAPQYGVVAQMPTLGDFDLGASIAAERSRPDQGSVGYYKTSLNNGIQIEFSSSEHAGLYQYTFPDGSGNTTKKKKKGLSKKEENNQTNGAGQPHVVANVTHLLKAPNRQHWTQKFVNGSIEVGDDGKSYTGYGTYKGGWAMHEPWTIYFCGEFQNDAESATVYKGTQKSDKKSASITASGNNDDQLGAIFSFPEGATDVRSKVGISFMSVDKACDNVDKEIKEYDVKKVSSAAKEQWADEVFNKIDVDTSNTTLASMMYSSFYNAHLMPTDRTGENPKWETSKSTPYYDDWFTLWDTFRSLMPLFHVFNTKRSAEMVSTLVSVYENEGFMPDGRSANENGKTQGGSNADIVLADAYVKGIGGEVVDWQQAYKAAVNDAEVQPPNNNDPMAPDSSTKEGRGALPDWLEYGYITRNYSRSVTRTIEYSMDDYGVAVLAKGLGKDKDYQKYLKRSGNWKNLWNKDATAKGYDYTGFIQPRNADGSFNNNNYDPLSCFGCYWGDDEYEGTPVEYGFSIPHDIETLVDLMGGKDQFIERLDDMFGVYGGKALADIGNEPSFLTPFLYNFVNSQSKTVETTRYLVHKYFNPSNTGLPGNSDAGAMQSWLIWNLIGLYPITGTSTYLISSPFVPYFQMKLDNGDLTITADNLDDKSGSVYVQELWVNDEKWDKNWVSHEDIFANGGKLHFVLGTKKSNWDADGDVPPSPGHQSS